MKFKPRVPDCPIEEIKNFNQTAYEIMMYIVRENAIGLYKENPEMYELGLEKCEEELIKLIDNGQVKVIMSGEGEDATYYLGVFNPNTGEYERKET